MQKTHGDRPRAAATQPQDDLFDLVIAGRMQYEAAVIDAFEELAAPFTRHQRVRKRGPEIVDVVAQLAADLDHVAETLRRDESGAGPFALDDEVRDRSRRTGDDVIHLAWLNSLFREYALESCDDRRHDLLMLAEHLSGMHGSIGASDHQVGKRSPDIEREPVANAVRCLAHRFPAYGMKRWRRKLSKIRMNISSLSTNSWNPYLRALVLSSMMS